MSRTRRTRCTLAAVAAAALAAVIAPTPAAAAPVTGGTLDWGIRTSFRNYIVGPIAQGTVAADAPATTNADGTFRFPAATGGDATAGGALDLAFTGAVHFRGHGYHDPAAGDLLRVSVSDIRIQGFGTATLIADITSLPLPADLANPGPAGAVQTYDDVAFATVALGGVTPEASGSGFVLRNVPVAITAAGAEAFAGFYAAGEPLDPLTLSLTTGAQPAATSTSTTATTRSSTSGNVGVTVAGQGGQATTSTPNPATNLAATGWSVGAAVAGLALLAAGIAFVATGGAARRVRALPVRVSDGGGGGAGRRR